jgi:small ligand-binding sensory domain FIST
MNKLEELKKSLRINLQDDGLSQSAVDDYILLLDEAYNLGKSETISKIESELEQEEVVVGGPVSQRWYAKGHNKCLSKVKEILERNK